MTAAVAADGAGPEDGGTFRGPIKLVALCVDGVSGALVHETVLFRIERPAAIHPLNSYSSPTPVIAGESVVCSFGDMGTACVDRSTGEVLWSNDLFDLDHETGPGSSPVVWRDEVILHLDGTDRQSIAALQVESGERAWETVRSGELHPDGMMKKAFCTPLVVEDPAGDVVFSVAANWVYGYDARSGAELWRLAYGKLGFSNVPRPVMADGRLFVCTGYNRASLIACEFPDGVRNAPVEVWRSEQKVPNMPTPLAAGSWLFMVSDDGVATVLDTGTGDRIWQQRLGGKFSSSPVLAGGRVVVGNHDGEVWILDPAAGFETLARHSLDGAVMATPACTPDAMFIRTGEWLYRIPCQPLEGPGKSGGG